jgi:hypothetical protein
MLGKLRITALLALKCGLARGNGLLAGGKEQNARHGPEEQ